MPMRAPSSPQNSDALAVRAIAAGHGTVMRNVVFNITTIVSYLLLALVINFIRFGPKMRSARLLVRERALPQFHRGLLHKRVAPRCR